MTLMCVFPQLRASLSAAPTYSKLCPREMLLLVSSQTLSASHSRLPCVDTWAYCADEANIKCPPVSLRHSWNKKDRWWAHHCNATCNLCHIPRFKQVQVYAGSSTLGALYDGEKPGTWQGQAGQDHTIAALFADSSTQNYFVDLAANVPVHHSNTRALERDFGWRGLCIEPNPRLMLKLAEHRSCTVVNALASQTGLTVQWRESLHRHWGSSIVSGGAEAMTNSDPGSITMQRQTVSLEDLLDANGAPNQISYLSLDVEGAEEQVLGAGFNFTKYTFLTMTVERPSPVLKERLRDAGYTYILEHGRHGDEMWVHRGFPGGVFRANKIAKACLQRWNAGHAKSGGYTDDGTPESMLAAAAAPNAESAICLHRT